MASPLGRKTLTAAALVIVIATSGCARVRNHQGYVADETLVGAIQPGVDNRDSVTGTLGRPTFVGQFDKQDWYYVSRDTSQLAFALPKPKKQQVIRVRFDDQGNVASVQRTGLEQIASITPTSETTPTLGRNRSFFQELFSNIGTVGAGGLGGGGQGQ